MTLKHYEIEITITLITYLGINSQCSAIHLLGFESKTIRAVLSSNLESPPMGFGIDAAGPCRIELKSMPSRLYQSRPNFASTIVAISSTI